MYDDDDTKAQDMMFMCIEESGEDLKYCKCLRKINFCISVFCEISCVD